MKMNGDSTSERIDDAETTTRRYNREELFRLAKLMPNTEQQEKDIQKYEATPCSKLNLASISNETASTQEDDQHLKFILRRQHSDLNFTSLSNERRFSNWRFSEHPKLSSMVPDFNAHERGTGSKFVKHNRIYSNISQSEHGSSSINYSRPTQLARTTYNLANWHRANSFVESPSYRAASRTGEKLDNKRSSLAFDDTEDVDFSPVQRFGAPETSSETPAGELKSTEDDDFDLTKLLSITVLSDIKTIRQDSQFNTGRRNNNITNRSNVRAQDGHSPRQFTRSHTSTDFTYNGRRLNSEYNHLKQNHRFQQQPTPLTQYHPTPDLYSFNHPRAIFPPQNYLIDGQKINSSKQVSKGATEDRDASIIESFKAQVRARAMDPTLTPSKLPHANINKDSNSQSNKSIEKQVASTAPLSAKPDPVYVEKHQPIESAELSHALSTQVNETMSLPIRSSESYQSAPRKSQIPLLVSLHRSKFEYNTSPKLDSKTKEATDTKTSLQNQNSNLKTE